MNDDLMNESKQYDGFIDRSADEDRGQMAQYNTLEYKPDLAFEERERTAWELSDEIGPGSGVNPDRPIGGGAIVDAVETIKEIEKIVNDKISEIERLYKQTPIISLPGQSEDIAKAKEALGLNPEKPLTFEDYIEAIKQRETPAGDYLTEVTERFTEGINGNLAMELYQDYVEINEEIAMIQEYFMRTINSILSDTPIDLTDEEWGNILYKKEQEWAAQKIIQTNQRIKRDELYKEAFLFNQGQIQRQKELRYREEKGLRQIKAEDYQLQNTLSIVQNKTQDLEQLVSRMESIESNGFDEQSHDKMQENLFLSIEDGAMGDDLTHVNLLLTLTVDDYNQEKHHYKHTLRDVYSNSNREKLMDELSVYQNLYRENVLPLSHNLRFYRTNPEVGTRNLLENLTKSMLNTTQQQQSRLIDWQNIQSGTSDLRRNKLYQVEEKEHARQEYRLFKEIQEKGGVE